MQKKRTITNKCTIFAGVLHSDTTKSETFSVHSMFGGGFGSLPLALRRRHRFGARHHATTRRHNLRRGGQPLGVVCHHGRKHRHTDGASAMRQHTLVAHADRPPRAGQTHRGATTAATTTICAAFGHYHRCCGCPSLHLRAAAHFALESFLFCGTRTRPSQPANG